MKNKILIGLTLTILMIVSLLTADVATKTRKRISELSAELESTKGKLDTLKTSEALKINKVNSLKEKISSLKKQIYNLKKEENSTVNKLIKINDKIQDYSEDITQNQKLLSKLTSELISTFYSSKSQDKSLIKNYQPIIRKCTNSILGNLASLEDNYNQSLNTKNQEKEILQDLILSSQKFQKKFSSSSEIKEQEMQELTELQKNEQKIKKDINFIQTSLNNLERLIKRYETNRSPKFSAENFKTNLVWPLTGTIIQHFGSQEVNGNGTTIFNTGIIIKPVKSSPVKSIAEGVVAYADWFEKKGKLVIIDHQNGFYSLYGFNKKILVKKGQKTDKGQTIALSGKIHFLDAICLYFELRKSGKAVDPLKYLPAKS